MEDPTYKTIKTIQEEDATDWIELGEIDAETQVFNISEQIIREDEIIRQHLDAFKFALRILISRLDNWSKYRPELKENFQLIIDLALKFEKQSWRCDALMQRRDDNVENILWKLKERALDEGYDEGRRKAMAAFREYKIEKAKLEKEKQEKEEIKKREQERKQREIENEEIDASLKPLSPNRRVSFNDDETSLIIDLTKDDLIDLSSPKLTGPLSPILEDAEMPNEEKIAEQECEKDLIHQKENEKKDDHTYEEEISKKRIDQSKTDKEESKVDQINENISDIESIKVESNKKQPDNVNVENVEEPIDRVKRRKNGNEKPYDPVNLETAATIEQIKIDGHREFELDEQVASNGLKYILIPDTDRAVESLEYIKNQLPRITVITMGLIGMDGKSIPASVHLDILLPCNLVSHFYLSKTTRIQKVDRFKVDVGWGNPIEIESTEYAKLALNGQNGKGRFEGSFVVVRDKRFNHKRIVLGRKFVSTFIRAVEIIETRPYIKGYVYLIRKGETLRHFFAEKTGFRCEFPPTTMYPYKAKEKENA